MLQYTVYKTTTDEKKQIDAPLNSSLGDRLRLIGQHEQLLNPTLAVKTFVVHENNVPTIVVLLGQDAGNASEFATCDWMETLTRLQTEVTLTPDAENLVKKLRSELEKARQKEQGVLEDVMRVVQAFKSDMEKKKIADAEYCRELERTAKNIYETQDRLNQQHLEIQRDLKERLEDREARLAVREEELRMRNKDIEQLRKQIDEM